MTENKVRVLAHRFVQGGVTMYMAPLAAKVINQLGVVDTWKSFLSANDPEQGYQREVVTAHAKKIANYVLDSEEKPLMPTAILLSSRTRLSFEPIDVDGEDVGWLTLEGPLYKVDGQHRTQGFEFASIVDPDIGNFPLPTVIMESRNKMEEIAQFHTVNATAKRVRIDLADRLLHALGVFAATPTQSWRGKAINIVDYLNRETDGPWEGLIKMPNTAGGTASQRTWTESLKPILNGVIGDLPADEIAKACSNYWQALAKLMPDAFIEPNDYVIQKSIGVFSLNEVAAAVFKMAYVEDKDFSAEHLRSVLIRAEDSGKLDASFWANTRNGGEAPMYAGRGGMASLAREMMDAFPDQEGGIST